MLLMPQIEDYASTARNSGRTAIEQVKGVPTGEIMVASIETWSRNIC